MPFWRKKESTESIELTRKKTFFGNTRHSARLTPGNVALLCGDASAEQSSYLNEISINHLKNGGSVVYMDNGDSLKDVEDIARNIDPDTVQIIQRSGIMTPGDAIRIGSRQTFSYLCTNDQGNIFRWEQAIEFVKKLSSSTVANKQNILFIVNKLLEKKHDQAVQNLLVNLNTAIQGTSFLAIACPYSKDNVEHQKNLVFLNYNDSKGIPQTLRKNANGDIKVVGSINFNPR